MKIWISKLSLVSILLGISLVMASQETVVVKVYYKEYGLFSHRNYIYL